MQIRISNLKNEGVYQGSKWLKLPVLCDQEELRAILDGSFFLIPLTGVHEGKLISSDSFLQVYGIWIEKLKAGKIPSDAELRQILACAWTEDLDSMWLQQIPGKGYLTKISRPVIQVQAHYFSYSSLDGVFRSMSMGEGSIFWGLQFSFPQIYQDPKTGDICPTKKNALFERIRSWSRERTRATPFVVNGKKTNVPIRLGKNCFSWIENHPQLILQHIQVET